MEERTQQSPPTPQPQVFTSSHTNVKRGILFGAGEIIFVVVVLLLLFGILNFFKILPVSKTIPFLSFLPEKSTSVTTTPIQQNTTSSSSAQLNLSLPYPLDEPALSDVRINYSLDGTITDIQPHPSDNTSLILVLKSSRGPTFPEPIPISKNQAVTASGEKTPISAEKLKIGNKISIVLTYIYSEKKLSVRTVQLIEK